MNTKQTIPKIWKCWITSTMSWHWDANCNIENPSVCFILATTYSNLSVFCQNKIPGQGQLSIKPLSESLGMFCARKQTIGYWSSPSFLVEDVWQDLRILIARAEYWVLIWISQYIFSLYLNLADNAWHTSFSEIEDSFYDSNFQETSQIKYSMKVTSRFAWVVCDCRCFSNWYWNFRPSRFLDSYNVMFRVGSSCSSTCPTLLPLQILRTHNNQYLNNNQYPPSRSLETLLNQQRCPEGILLSLLLLCLSESANDQNHCRTYAIWHGFFSRAYAIWLGFLCLLARVRDAGLHFGLA